MSATPFGYQFRKQYFTYLDSEVNLLNHGSFGTTPAVVVEAAKRALEEQERYPDASFFCSHLGDYTRYLQIVSEYLGLEYKNCAFVTNATTGVNAVLRSIPFNFQEDKILFHSTTYGACANTVKFLHDYFGLQYDVVDINYPCEDEIVVKDFQARLQTKEYKVCLFDMVTSQPGVKLPYEELIKLCKKYGTWSLIDGAHAAGQIDFTFINELKPDFLTTNLHKWLSCPKSVALLYVDPKHHAMIQTFPVSHNYIAPSCQYIEGDDEHNSNLLINKFAFVGTASYTSYFAVEEAVKFRRDACGGEENIRKYQWQLQEEAIPRILEIFGKGSSILDNSTKTLRVPGLFCVELPIPSHLGYLVEKMFSDRKYFLQYKGKVDSLMFQQKTYAPFQINNGHLFIRFSAQVFNERSDYEKGAPIIKEIFYRVLNEDDAEFKQL
ncbi:unnamed protein product [Kluyveromyces dobzhanskii CBS 2104]|uniref:WGS project CCBQ000000000 data, contig 00058 n=1 Tax=Kluyveromyces dobzhanskii CBS 2104 TaxID=1427455 RepID=A0A0A8LDK6_9SACH|nr:unnamed protein product [Kluyveromyces dobzhanskii CBS 2104]